MKAVVLLSGGQDSVTALYWAKEQFNDVYAISFDYGQRHAAELKAAQKIAHIANVKHEVIDIKHCLKSTSPLVSDNDLETYDSYDQMDEVIGDRQELTFVPMRNSLFLTVAANRCDYLNFDNIVIGVCEMDNANYDDCRSKFIESAEEYINYSLGGDQRNGKHWIMVHAPLLKKSKAETINMARSLNAMEAMSYSHTCYAGQTPPCGECHSCVLRAQGFKDAGIDDPIFSRYS